MTPAEEGFLLLTAHLGNPDRHPLTIAQFRDLTQRARTMEKPMEQRELTEADLLTIGCNREFAQRIVSLLSQTQQLQWYVEKGRSKGCTPVTRVSDRYPRRLRKCLGLDAPGVLWMKGNTDFLTLPTVALVGSRELASSNRQFAREVGRQAAKQGFALVSGHARGADREAQDSCLEYGGKVISVVSDELEKYPAQDNVLYISEDGFDSPFSAQRALRRNRVIHSLGQKTFVAQCGLGKGGTWDGTSKNLRYGWSPVFCFNDGSEGCRELARMGAIPIGIEQLYQFSALKHENMGFIDR